MFNHAIAPQTGTLITKFEITDRFGVTPPDSGHDVELWCPIISDSPHQRLLDLEVRTSAPYELTRESEFGNLVLHSRARPTSVPMQFELQYTVERAAPVGLTVDGSLARPLATPQLFARTLAPERHVDVDDRTRALALAVTAGETNPLEQARRFYDHVTGAMTYDAHQQSYVGSTDHALTCSVGNCNDIHALFVSLCRSVGIPARFVLGQALEPGLADCDVCGYHCWAEFFIAGLGWLPADASCATKYGTHGLFGTLEPNHVAWSVGRDLLLEPPPRSGRRLFFAGPYAEAGGTPHPVERRIVFTSDSDS